MRSITFARCLGRLALLAASLVLTGGEATAEAAPHLGTKVGTVVREVRAAFKTTARAPRAGLVNIGEGRKMYLRCRGTGSPTAVLISGFRGAYDDWTSVVDTDGEPKRSGSAVFPEVGKFTRVCAYDRPGTTRLDDTPTPSTPVRQPTIAQAGAADLHALLRAAGQPGPYVIVAHSWGGLIARLYASQYPNDVAGLVLLEPGSEFLQDTLTRAQWTMFVRAGRKLGKPRTLEAASYQPSVRALRAAPPIGDIPAVVLTADKCWLTFPGEDAAEAGATCSAWLAAQDLLAALLDARHVTDTNSSHFVQGENPQLVIDSVREVVEGVRENACARGSKKHGQCFEAKKPRR